MVATAVRNPANCSSLTKSDSDQLSSGFPPPTVTSAAFNCSQSVSRAKYGPPDQRCRLVSKGFTVQTNLLHLVTCSDNPSIGSPQWSEVVPARALRSTQHTRKLVTGLGARESALCCGGLRQSGMRGGLALTLTALLAAVTAARWQRKLNHNLFPRSNRS